MCLAEAIQKIADNLVNSVLYVLLCTLLVFKLSVPTELIRSVVVLIAGIIVSRNNQNTWISNNFILIELGNVSYSVYLLHWPLFTLYRYVYESDDSVETNFQGYSKFLDIIQTVHMFSRIRSDTHINNSRLHCRKKPLLIG